jgi:hypothetical protein
MDPDRLSAELEAALVGALADAWRTLNETYFKGALRSPAIALIDGASRLGEWRAGTRTLALQRALVVDRPWGIVVEVLKHEVAHQYVSEALGEPDPTPHGPAFRAICERLGIDARASGLPAAAAGDAPGADQARVLGRIAKLLALAASQNRHEAEAAMARAQELMLKHNLEAPPSRGGYGFRHLGAPTGRVGEPERILANLLGDHFFVEVIWVPVWRPREGKRGSVLEVAGSPVNLEMAEYVYEFLRRTADRLWLEYRRDRGLGSNRDRLSFLAGVMAGFRDKLAAQAEASAQAGLVWVGDADLRRYHRRRHPYVRWTRHAGAARTEAHQDGRAAGQSIVLHRPVESRGADRSGRRLLT